MTENKTYGLSLLLVVCWFLMSGAQGATYYIDPGRGSITNNGSESTPWNTLSSVVSAGKLKSVVKGGDTVYLRNGYHGRPHLEGISYSSLVTIMAEPGQTDVRLAELRMTNLVKCLIDGIKISPYYCGNCYTAATTGSAIVLGRGGVRDVTLRNCEVFSYPWTVAQSWTTQSDLLKRSLGIKFKSTGNANITVQDCSIYLVVWGITISNTQNVRIEGNRMNAFGPGDLMQIEGSGTLDILNNYCTNVIRFPADGAHCDLIQVENGTFNGVRIMGNRIYQRDGNHPFPQFAGVAQGFFGGGSCSDIRIEGNILANSHNHGINFGRTKSNTRVINNTVICLNPGSYSSPINVAGGGSVVANNFAFSFSAINTANNVTLTSSNLSAYFVDPANYDYRLKPGSPAVDKGANQYVQATTDAFGGERIFNGTVDIGAHEFGSTGSTGSQVSFYGSPLTGAPPVTVTFGNTSSAEYAGWLWDFGDGTTSTEKAPAHTYHAYGVYTVTLTGTGKDGSKAFTRSGYVTVQKSAIVMEAEAMTLDNYRIDSRMNNQGILIENTTTIPTTGTATGTFAGPGGVYTITVNVSPENDGFPTIKLLVGSRVVLQEVYPAGGVDPATSRYDFTVQDVNVNTGDLITLEGTSDGTPAAGAFARVDKITFQETVPAAVTGPWLAAEHLPGNVSVYPSPAAGMVRIHLPVNAESDLTILTGAGQEIAVIDPGTDARVFRWNSAAAGPGLYIYRFRHAGSIWFGKLLKVQ